MRDREHVAPAPGPPSHAPLTPELLREAGVTVRAARRARGPRRRSMLALVTVVVAAALVGTLAVAGGAPAAALDGGVPIAASSDVATIVVSTGPSAGRSAGVTVSDRSLLPGRLRASAAGVTGQWIYADDAGNAIGARWVYAPGAAPVNTRIDTWLREQFATHAAHAGLPWPSMPVSGAPPGGMAQDRGCERGGTLQPVAELLADRRETPLADAEGTALVISCDIVLAQGSVLGLRFRASEVRFVGGLPMLVSDRVQTFYSDTGTGESAEGAELFKPGATQRVVALIHAAVTAVQGRAAGSTVVAQALRDGFDTNTLLRDATPLGDGGIVIRVPADAFDITEPGAPDPIAVEVRLSAAQLAGVLSPMGVRASGAAAVDAPWTGTAAPGPARTPCDLVPCLALTFDDGPGDYTAAILDALNAGGASGSFFLVGQNVAAHPELVAREAIEGHTLGNHTYTHLNFSITPRDQIQRSIEATDAAVRAACGRATDYVRPPWGVFNRLEVQFYEHPVALWSADSHDWQDPSVAALLDRINAAASPGAILLMHDTHAVTAEAMPEIVAALTARGYRLVGLSSLIGPKPVASVTTRVGT